MKINLKALAMAAVFCLGTLAQASEVTEQKQNTLGVKQTAEVDGSCQLAVAVGRCPACCTGCGTKKEDCSACKPKDDKGKVHNSTLDEKATAG